MQTRKRRREWDFLILTLATLNLTRFCVKAETPFSAAELSNEIRDMKIMMDTMNTKISTAHYNYRILEAEIRSIRIDFAPKIHGHPSIRRRIKNALQPQLDQINRELRALKSESEYRKSQPSNGAESDNSDVRTKLQQLEMRISPLEAEQNTLREHFATSQVAMAHQRVTSQRVEDIQSDLEVNSEKIISFGAKLQSLENEDKIIVEDVRTALTKFRDDIDNRFEGIVADIPSAPIELDFLELERVNDRIDLLNSSMISSSKAQSAKTSSSSHSPAETVIDVPNDYVTTLELNQLESKWNDNLRSNLHLLAGQFTNLTDGLASELDYMKMMFLIPRDVPEEISGRLKAVDEQLATLSEAIEKKAAESISEAENRDEAGLAYSVQNITAATEQNLLLINLNAIRIQEHDGAIFKLIDSLTTAGEQLREISSNVTEGSIKTNSRVTVVEQAMSGTAKQISDLNRDLRAQQQIVSSSQEGLANSALMMETFSESIRNIEMISSSFQKRLNKTQKAVERLANNESSFSTKDDQFELANLSGKFNALDSQVEELANVIKADHATLNAIGSNYTGLELNFADQKRIIDELVLFKTENGILEQAKSFLNPKIDAFEMQQAIFEERLDLFEENRHSLTSMATKVDGLATLTNELSDKNAEILVRVNEQESTIAKTEQELKKIISEKIEEQNQIIEENLQASKKYSDEENIKIRDELEQKASESSLSVLTVKSDELKIDVESFRAHLASRRSDISKISSTVQDTKTQIETITFLTDDLAARVSKYEHSSEAFRSSLVELVKKQSDSGASFEDSLKILSERQDELEKTKETANELSLNIAEIKEGQDKLEGQLIEMSFLIDDELTTFNNSINVMKTQMSHSLSSKIQHLKESLSGEMSVKMGVLSENLRKVNTTSLSASELRSLLETKILQQQVGQKNLEEKLVVVEGHLEKMNERQTTDYDSLKSSISTLDSQLLDASNRAEQALSTVSMKAAEITEKLEDNKDLYERQQGKIDSVSSRNAELEKEIAESKPRFLEIENAFGTLTTDVSGLIDSHAQERKQIMQQRQVILKLTDNYDDLRSELSELEDDLRPQSEALFKSVRVFEARVLNLATNVTQFDRAHQNNLNIVSGRIGQMQEQINSNMAQTLRGQSENSEYIDKKFGQLLHNIDRVAQRLATAESKGSERAKEIGLLKSDFTKIEAEVKSTMELFFKLANKAKEIERLVKVNADEVEKRMQILQDKLIVPINHQAGKHSALEQLLVSEIEKIENSVKNILRGEALLNTTVIALSERTRNNEAIFSNSMEANRNFHMSINSRISSVEADVDDVPEKLEDIENSILVSSEEDARYRQKIRNELAVFSEERSSNKKLISELASSVQNWEKATGAIGEEIDLVKDLQEKETKKFMEAVEKMKEDILLIGIQTKQQEDAVKVLQRNTFKNSSIIFDETKQIFQQIAYLTEDMDVFHERLQQLEGVWSTSFETLATQLTLDDSSGDMSSDSNYDSYTVLDDEDYLDDPSSRAPNPDILIVPGVRKIRKRRESAPNKTQTGIRMDQIHKIAGVFRKYRQMTQTLQQRIATIEEELALTDGQIARLQKSVEYTEGKLLENHKQLKLNLDNYSKNAASIVDFGHKFEDVKAVQSAQSLKLKTVDRNKEKLHALEVAIGEQSASLNLRFADVSDSQASLMHKFEVSKENFNTNLFTIESSIKYMNETYTRETKWIKERADKLKKIVDESDENVDLKLSILENRLKPEILEWKTKHFEALKRLGGEVGAIQKESDASKKLFDDIIEDYTSIVAKTDDIRKTVSNHDDHLTKQEVKIEAILEDSTSLTNDLADVKMTLHENLSDLKSVSAANKNDLASMKDKFNSLYKSMETMTNGEEFVAQLAKIERVVSLSNSTLLSSLSDAKQKFIELKAEYEADLKQLSNSLTITESKLSANIAQQVKKIELEFMMLNSDVRNQLKSASESAKVEMQKMHNTGDFSRLSTRVSAIENTHLESQERIQEALEGINAYDIEQKLVLSRFNSTLASLALASGSLKTRMIASDETVANLSTELGKASDSQGELIGKVLRLENSLEAFTKSAKTHVHEYLHEKLKTLENKELDIQAEVRKLKELVADAEQELDRVKSLEAVFKENVDSSVRRLRQEFDGLKNAREIADFRLERQVADRISDFQKSLVDDRGSEKALKMIANRTRELSESVRQEIEDLQEEFVRLESSLTEQLESNSSRLARTLQSSAVDAVRRNNDVSSKMTSLRSDIDSLTLVATRQAGTFEELLSAAVLKINSLIDKLTQTTSEQETSLSRAHNEIGQLSTKVAYLKSNTLDKSFWKYDDFDTIYKQVKNLVTFNVELKLAQLRSALDTKIVDTKLMLEQDCGEMEEKIDELAEKLSSTARFDDQIRAVQERADQNTAQLKKTIVENNEDLTEKQGRLVTLFNNLRAKLGDVERDDFSGLASAVDRQGRTTSNLASKVESHENKFDKMETILSTLGSEQNSKQENELILSTIREMQDDIRLAKVNSTDLRTLLYHLDGNVEKLKRQSTTSFETMRRGVDVFRESVSAQISNVSQIVARLDQTGSEDSKREQMAELGALITSQGQDCQDRFNRLNDKVISNTNSLENFRREIRSWTTKLISIVDDFDKIGKSISDLFEIRDALTTRVETNERQITSLQTVGGFSGNDRRVTVAADFEEYVTIDQLLQDMADLRHEIQQTLSTQLDKLSGDFSELLKDSTEDSMNSVNQFKSEVNRNLQEVKVINGEQIAALTSEFNSKIDSTLKLIETYAKSDGFDDSISDYDQSDAAQGQNLGEKIERMEYQIDQLVNEVDDLNGNITNREYLAEVLDSVSSLKTQVDRLDNDGRAQIDGIKLEIDKLIPDVMEPIGKLDSRMKNIEHAYKLFNLTNEFSFDSLKEKIKRIDVRVDDLGSQISKISLGHSVPIFAGANRPGPFDGKDVPVVNSLSKPHSKPAEEWSSWSKCSVSCGNGIMTRHMKSDIEKKVCNLGSCSCWGEWGAWSACTKSCGTGITERSRAILPGSTASECEGTAQEVAVCGTHSCFGDRVMLLGGRGSFMQHMTIFDASDNTISSDISALQRSSLRLPKLAMHCTAALNNAVFIIGGYYTRYDVRKVSGSDCHISDPLPVRSEIELMQHQCVEHDGEVWICSAYHKPQRCDSFDGERFTRRTDLDHNHLKGAMVSVPERGLVMIGGAEGSRRTSSSVEILQNGRWREGPTFPNGGITDSTASVVGGDILIFGGTMESRASDRVYRLAAGSSYWQLMANRLKMPRKQHLSIGIGGSVYLFFGYRETYPIEKWDVIRDESTAIAGETSEMWKNRLFASISLLPGDVCLNLA